MAEALRLAADLALGVAGQVLLPQSSAYWAYLLSAFAIALGVYLWRERGEARPSLRAALAYCFPRSVYGHRSFRHDLAIFAVNALLYSFLLLAPMAGASMLAATQTHGLLAGHAGSAGVLSNGVLAKAIATLGVLVVADFAFFASHYVQHRVPLLWEFHKVHHSAPVLNPLTVFRRHPVDVVIERGLTGLLVGGVLGAFAHLTGGQVDAFTILEVNAGLFLFLLAGFNLQHRHVWLSFGPLNRVVISPATHQIHHSTDARHHDKNFGNVFAFWDWIAGTLYLPRQRERLQFGLGEEGSHYDSVWQLYWWPVRRAAGQVTALVRR